MRSKLNPDGALIRALRIQRGWTQEQLAEIAGVSPRTIQRAEAANAASFETLRAVAGAFEKDFDQLLKSEGCSASDPEPHIPDSSDIKDSGPEIITIPVNSPGRPARWIWAMSLPAVFTLAAGLLAGIFLTHHFEISRKLPSPAAPGRLVLSPQTAASRKPAQLIITAKEPAGSVPRASTRAAVPSPSFDSAQIPRDSSSGERSIEFLLAAEPVSGNTLQGTPVPVSPDLSLQSQSLLPALLPLENPVVAENGDEDESEIGAVRTAVDLAAKKTGTFVSKVGASIKRVF